MGMLHLKARLLRATPNDIELNKHVARRFICKDTGHCEGESKPRAKRGGKRRGNLIQTTSRLLRFARNDR